MICGADCPHPLLFVRTIWVLLMVGLFLLSLRLGGAAVRVETGGRYLDVVGASADAFSDLLEGVSGGGGLKYEDWLGQLPRHGADLVSPAVDLAAIASSIDERDKSLRSDGKRCAGVYPQ